MHKGCILWGSRVVVPEQDWEMVLQELHDGHPGVIRMKSLTRMVVWWPGINKDIDQYVRTCQVNQLSPPAMPMQPWKWPTQPWARLHLDYAGPSLGRMFLIQLLQWTAYVKFFTIWHSRDGGNGQWHFQEGKRCT